MYAERQKIMRGDMPQPALRLMSSCVVRTHERRIPERVNLGNPLPVKKAHSLIFGKGGKARKVMIGGVTYPSATDAARTLRRSTAKIYEWLRSGEAEYV